MNNRMNLFYVLEII